MKFSKINKLKRENNIFGKKSSVKEIWAGQLMVRKLLKVCVPGEGGFELGEDIGNYSKYIFATPFQHQFPIFMIGYCNYETRWFPFSWEMLTPVLRQWRGVISSMLPAASTFRLVFIVVYFLSDWYSNWNQITTSLG